MKATAGQKTKIGIFTFVGILVLILIVFFIGNQKNLFSSTFGVYGTFKNVNGLQVGNNVRFAGINVGVVQNITIVTDSSVRVDLTLNDDVKKFIKTDSKISIGSDGLMGDKLVVIAPGGIKSTTPVQAGGQLASVNPLDVDRIINKLTKVADNAESLTSGLSEIVAKINAGKGIHIKVTLAAEAPFPFFIAVNNQGSQFNTLNAQGPVHQAFGIAGFNLIPQ